jgi:hypothetical protein
MASPEKQPLTAEMVSSTTSAMHAPTALGGGVEAGPSAEKGPPPQPQPQAYPPYPGPMPYHYAPGGHPHMVPFGAVPVAPGMMGPPQVSDPDVVI